MRQWTQTMFFFLFVFESLAYIYSPKDIVIVTLELIGTDLLSLGLNHNIDCFGY